VDFFPIFNMLTFVRKKQMLQNINVVASWIMVLQGFGSLVDR